MLAQAAGESLEERRENYSFAQLYQGPWGPVWLGCGDEWKQKWEERLGLQKDQDMSFVPPIPNDPGGDAGREIIFVGSAGTGQRH